MQSEVQWSTKRGAPIVKARGDNVKATYGVHVDGWTPKEMDDGRRRERRRKRRQDVVNCCKKVAAFLFSHIGLAAMVVAYSIMGGVLFKALEGPFEKQEKMKIQSKREDLIDDIWKIATAMINNNFPRTEYNFTYRIRNLVEEFQKDVVVAVKDKGWDGNDWSDNAEAQWSFAGALLYAVTVITTIGYGHVAPKTAWGRLVTIVYAIIGIPLTFLYLSNIGNFLADCFRLFYKKVCCDICCCQKCERKKKQRLQARKMALNRERAAQINIAMNQSPTSYGARETNGGFPDGDPEVGYLGASIGLPGGDENLAYEEDQDDVLETISEAAESKPRSSESLNKSASSQSSHRPSVRNRKGNNSNNVGRNNHGKRGAQQNLQRDSDEENVRETAILDDVYDSEEEEVRETAILDSDDEDDDNASLINDAAVGARTPNSDIHVSHGTLDRLGDARETAILDDSNDELEEEEEGVDNPATDLRDEDGPGKDKELTKKEEKLLLKQQKKEDKKAAKEQAKKEKEERKQREKETKLSKKSKEDKKVKDRDKAKDRKNDNGRDAVRPNDLEIEPQDSPGPSREDSTKSKRGKYTKNNDKLSRKGTVPGGRAKDGSVLRRKRSSRRRVAAAEAGDELDEDVEASRGPSYHRSDDSFVTAQGDSISYIGELGGDGEEELEDDDLEDMPSKEPLDPDAVGADDPGFDIELSEFQNTDFHNDNYYESDPFDMAIESEEKVTVPISICLIIIAAYIFGGSMLFTLWEDWDYLTGSYFCFITLSTIGFGDIVPGTDMNEWEAEYKLVLCSLWLAFGLSLLAMCFNLMQEEVKEKCKWLGRKLGLLKSDQDGERVLMN